MSDDIEMLFGLPCVAAGAGFNHAWRTFAIRGACARHTESDHHRIVIWWPGSTRVLTAMGATFEEARSAARCMLVETGHRVFGGAA